MNDRFRVKVYKPYAGSDDRKTLEGEKMQTETVEDKDGKKVRKDFFIISAARADYINKMFKHYSVSEPFIPGVDDAKLVKLMNKPEDEPEKKQ